MIEDALSKLFQVSLKHFNSRCGQCDIIALRDMDIAVSHLCAEQMRRRIHFCHQCSERMPQIMIFERNSQLAFNFPRGIFE